LEIAVDVSGSQELDAYLKRLFATRRFAWYADRKDDSPKAISRGIRRRCLFVAMKTTIAHSNIQMAILRRIWLSRAEFFLQSDPRRSGV